MNSVNEMMYEKLRNEFDSYKDDIAQMSPYEIISKAKSVVIRENIVEAAAHAFSMDNIEPEKLAELLKETNLLGRIADVVGQLVGLRQHANGDGQRKKGCKHSFHLFSYSFKFSEAQLLFGVQGVQEVQGVQDNSFIPVSLFRKEFRSENYCLELLATP